MKKLLLTILCGMGLACTASAGVYTYTMADVFANDGVSVTEWTCGDFTFTTAKLESNTDPAYNKNNKDVRVYAKGSLTISTSAEEAITGVSFDISAQGLKRFTTITPSVGEIVEQGKNPLIWTGSAKSIEYTVGDKAVYGTEGESKPGQFDFTAVTIYTGSDAPDTTPDEPQTPDTPENTITSLASIYSLEKGAKYTMGIDLTVVYVYNANIYVSDGTSYAMIYKYDLGLKAGDLLPKGWTGSLDIYNNLYELVPDEAITAQGTAAIPEPVVMDAELASVALTPDNQNMYVKLIGVTFADKTPATKVNNFNGVMGEGDDAITVTFRNNYFVESVTAGTYDVVAFIGVYGETIQLYPVEYIGESGEIEVPVLDSFNAIPDIEEGVEFIIGVDVKVIYANGAYVYVNDGYQNALIYKKNLGLNAGDVIAKGWKATVTVFRGLYEIVPQADALDVASTGAELPEPVEVEASDVPYFVAAYNQAAYLKLKNVTFADATPASGSFTGTMGNETVNFYQRFNLPTVEAGEYDVTGFVAVYNTDVQIYPIAFEAVSGIKNITTDADTNVKYYNIQGILINNPQPGNIYIRVAGDKAEKVIK